MKEVPDVIHERLDVLALRYRVLLEAVRGVPQENRSIDQAALSGLSKAIEEMTAAVEDLRHQNGALRDAYSSVEQERLQYEELFGLLPDAYLVTDLFGTIVEVNATGEEMLGVAAMRLRGKPLAVYIADEDRKGFRRSLNEVAESPTPVNWSGIVQPRNGLPFRASIRIVRIPVTGDRVRLGWLIHDTSVQQRVAKLGQRFAEEQSARIAAERASRRFRLLAEASRHLSSGKDVTAICAGIAKAIIRFSADHCEILLLDGEALTSVSRITRDPKQAEFVKALRRRHKLSVASPDNLIDQAIRTREIQVSPPVIADIPSGVARKDMFASLRNTIARNAVVVPILGNEQCIGVIVVMSATPEPTFGVEEIGVLSEIAERTSLAIANARLFGQLEQSNRERAEFLAVLSHELRTPISAVIGYSDLLLSNMAGQLSETALQHIQRIRSSAWHQIGVVEQILSYARVDQQLTLEYVDTDVQSVVQDALDLVTPLARRKDIALTVDIPSTQLPISTDVGSLRQILVNLLSNALKFTTHGAVTVSARRTDEDVYIAVTDTGHGIKAEDLARIFDPFWRGRRVEPGMGLGLSVSRRLTKALCGELTVQSQLGVGTKFTLKVPLSAPDRKDAPARDS